LRLTHVEAAVLAASPDPSAAQRIRDALAACVERVALREVEPTIAAVCAALETCEAPALLIACDALGDLAPRAALALIAGMPARGGPELVAFERNGTPDLRLAVIRREALPRIRERGGFSRLESLLVPAGWL
jgi:cytochrome P450